MGVSGRDMLKKRIEKYWNFRSTSYELDFEKSLETQNEWESTINALVDHRKTDDASALDVGTGPGQLAFYLAKAGFNTTGIDISPAMIARAEQKAQQDGLVCNFKTGDAEHLAFADNTFDVVVTRNLVWTLPDPGAAVREWHRVLKPGGRIIISDGYWQNTTWSRLHRLILKGARGFYKQVCVSNQVLSTLLAGRRLAANMSGQPVAAVKTDRFISCRFFSCYAGLIKGLPLYEGVRVNDACNLMRRAGFKDTLSWDTSTHFSKNPYGAGQPAAPVFFIVYADK